MILKKLVINNYKQHAHREINFEGNVIGFLGRNGSGKSNLLGSLHYALGGEQPGFTKDQLLRWGTDTGDVSLDFEHFDREGHISRNIHTATARFTYGDEETISGVSKVAEAVHAYLGLDRDLLRQTIFVRQAEIDAILFTDPRVRELAFQKLCGIGEANVIHRKGGEVLTSFALPPNYDEQIADGTKRVAEMNERLSGLKTTMAQATEARAKCPNVEALQGQLAYHESLRVTLTRHAEVSEELEKLTVQISEAEVELLKLQSVPDTDIGELDKQIDEAQKLLVSAQLYQQALAEWEASGKVMVALGDAPMAAPAPHTQEELDKLVAQAEELKGQYAGYLSQLSMYQTLLEALKNVELLECPICGGPIKDTSRLEKLVIDVKATVEGIDISTAPAMARTAAQENDQHLRTQQAATSTYNAQYAANIERYKRAEEALQGAQKVTEALEGINDRLTQLQAARTGSIAAIQRRTQLTTEKETAGEQLLKQQQNAVALMQSINEAPDIAAAYSSRGTLFEAEQAIQKIVDKVKTDLAESQQLDQQMAQLTGMTQELEGGLNTLENTIATLEHKRSQQGARKDAVKVLTEVRDWFHYANGPRTLTMSVLSDMTQDVNQFLGQFGAPFSVESADTSMGFNCVFHDGRSMPVDGPPDASQLSGGEKIQLAVSFRFASYCMFANKLGLLSLDEPTIFLDDANVGRFCALLAKVKEVARSMNLQVLIATHERAVIPFMDTIVDLSSETQEESQ